MPSIQPRPLQPSPQGRVIPAAPAGPSKPRWWLWGLIVVVQVGVVAGAFRLGSWLAAGKDAVEGKEEQTGSPPAEVRAESAPPAPRGDLDEADMLIRTARFELALAICKPASESAVAKLRDAFAYRLGLCLEGLGRWDQAVTAYRAVASRSPSRLLVAAAQLGQARVWLRMRRTEAGKPLLCNIILNAGDPALRRQPLLADARYLLGLALALDALGIQRPDPDNDTPVSHTSSDWSLERALDWSDAGKSTPSPPAALPPEPDTLRVQRVGTEPEQVLVRARMRETIVTEFLAQVAEQARLSIEWSAQARQQAEGRIIHVAFDSLPLPDLLRAFGESLGLTWKIGKGKVVLLGEQEVPPEAAKAHRLSNAQRALSEAVLYYPGHPLTPFAYLELGNLEAKTGKLDEALAWYSRLAREWPHTPLLIEAHFNRGLIQRRAGENAAARQSFYRVVDRAPGHELAQLAYNHIGRLHLEDDEPDKALSPLRRALVASRDVPVQPSVALTLACAYLLGNNPRAANRVLVENRALVSQLEYRRAAAFLDTLARYRACTDRKLKQRESADLLTCLLTLHDENFLGPPGLLLLAQSYRDLGMNDRLIAFATKALPRLRGPLAIEMSATLADAYYATDKQAQAAALYARVAAGRGPQAVPARLRLAEIALKSKNSNECLKWCRRLLQEPGTTDAGVILRLMAGAYELAGERDKAIRCLSGKVPP